MSATSASMHLPLSSFRRLLRAPTSPVLLAGTAQPPARTTYLALPNVASETPLCCRDPVVDCMLIPETPHHRMLLPRSSSNSSFQRSTHKLAASPSSLGDTAAALANLLVRNHSKSP